MGECDEKQRTYVFDNKDITVKDVIKVDVSKSGGHRITTKDGGMVYVAPKWLAINIISDHGWQFWKNFF